jgi:plastocyanin
MPRVTVLKITTLLLLFLSFAFAAVSVSAVDEKLAEQRRAEIVEGFLTGLIDRAVEPGTTAAEKGRLLRSALVHAKTYSRVVGDDALHQMVHRRLLALTSAPASTTSPTSLTSEDKKIILELQERALHGSNFSRSLKRVKVRELVEALIGRALEVGTQIIEREGLLEAASDLAKRYGEKAGDDIFNQRMQRLISTLPPAYLPRDEDIIREFNKALAHDNKLVMKFLVKKVAPRIEPFVTGIIERAGKRSTPDEEKEMLLKTAMNFAKTLGNITGDHTFHRAIHRRTFTARLAEPVRGTPTVGVHTINAPKATRTLKNIFRPDNLIINAGETVRWVNHDEITHVIGTLDFLSDGRFFNPSVGPRSTFERTFFIPGEYYYICYIHNSMIGKLTVTER